MKNIFLVCCTILLAAIVNVSNAREVMDYTGQSAPQKTTAVAHISVFGTQGDKVHIIVNDSTGKEVYSEFTGFEVTGVKNFAIDPPGHLAKGNYFITLITGQNTFKHQVIIK